MKLPVCELNHPDQTEAPTPHDCDTEARDVATVVSVQVANGVPFSVAEKLTVILTRTVAEPAAAATVTLLLTVHDVGALQSGPKRIFSTGRTTASGSTAPCSACTSACRIVKTGPIGAASSAGTLNEEGLVPLTPRMRGRRTRPGVERS